jgi:hypothetical protein
MHPEGVPVLFGAIEKCDPYRGRGGGGVACCPGVARRAEECDPFRVEDGDEEDANHGVMASVAPRRIHTPSVCEWREQGKTTENSYSVIIARNRPPKGERVG